MNIERHWLFLVSNASIIWLDQIDQILDVGKRIEEITSLPKEIIAKQCHTQISTRYRQSRNGKGGYPISKLSLS